MKKSISSGMTGWTKKFGGLFRAAPGENGKRKIEISEPLRQVGGTSVDHVQSLFQIRDHLLEIEKSAKYMNKLIEKNQKELIPQVVTLIIDTVQKMLDDIVVIVGRQPEISTDDKWNLFFESRQQEARNYLAALVKLSDSNSEISHDDTQMTQEMVQKLEKVLRNILDYANFKFPVAPLPSQAPFRKSLHASIENLEYLGSGEIPRARGLRRNNIRRSFRTISRKTKELISSSSSIRPPSMDGANSGLVKRRHVTGRSRSVIGRQRSNQSDMSEGLTFLSLNSADLHLENDRSNIDVRNSNDQFSAIGTSSPAGSSYSRPLSSNSYSDVLSTSCSSGRFVGGPEIVVDGPPMLPEKGLPPILPPKKNKPLGGLNVFTPQKNRFSMVSSDSRDSYLNEKTEQSSDLSLIPPEIPEKRSSPSKNHRDSGYNELNDSSSMLGTPDQMVEKVLSQNVKSDFIEAFLSSFRTFLPLENLIDQLLKRIRQADTCASASGIPVQILIRVVDQLVYTELNDNIKQKLDDEIFWMMTHREKNFLNYAKQLRDSVQRIVKKKNSAQRPLSMGALVDNESESLTKKLRSDGTKLLDYTSDTFAQHLCILDADFYRSIEPSEFVLAAMSETQDSQKTPNFSAAVDHFNSVSYWTQGLILSQNSPGKDATDLRERILNNFFKILSHLRKNNNFNSYFAVVAGVSSKAVTRLHWKSSIHEKIQEFQKITSVDKNFINYRPVLKDSELPCVPYIGIVRQDLYQVHLREKPMKDGMVNFDRVMRIHKLLEQTRRFRESKYDFQKSADIDRRFCGFQSLQNDDKLWEMSYLIRPLAEP